MARIKNIAFAETLYKAMKKISELRTVFHSEADFQHALAWELHNTNPTWNFRLEYPFTTESKILYLDLLMSRLEHKIAIELKYKTREANLNVSGECYRLKSHGARDFGAYGFFKDIGRLEKFVQSDSRNIGVAIFLTNGSSYWENQGHPDFISADFTMKEERLVSGVLKRGKGVPRKERELPIELIDSYELNWHYFSFIDSETYNEFRYLCIEVKAASPKNKKRPSMHYNEGISTMP